MSHFPYLLYAYPWMPFPRRVIIYLREKRIPTSLITIVRVSDPQLGDKVIESTKYPPRPTGSLPILVIPIPQDNKDQVQPGQKKFTYIRQSVAIMNYIDELCDAGLDGFPLSKFPMRGTNAVERARITEIMALTDECLTGWNPVRMFGTGAGTMSFPAGAAEMLRWVRRGLMGIEKLLDGDGDGDREDGRKSIAASVAEGRVTMADISLYNFLDFTLDCYGVDMTRGTGEVSKDVYGRDVKDEMPRLKEFFEAFRKRESARRDRDAGEFPSKDIESKMMDWAEGVHSKA